MEDVFLICAVELDDQVDLCITQLCEVVAFVHEGPFPLQTTSAHRIALSQCHWERTARWDKLARYTCFRA